MTTPDQLHEELRALAERGEVEAFRERAAELHASDLADVLAGLDEGLQVALAQMLPAEMVSEALVEMERDEHPEAVLAALNPEQAADIVEELDDDDAADLIAELPPHKATPILESVDDRAEIERLLEYDEESAGGIMTSTVVAISDQATAADAIDEIRRMSAEIDDIYQVYCIAEGRRLVGVLPLQILVKAPAGQAVREIMEAPPCVATPEMDQEEVARLMARYNVASLPVIDAQERLLGRITFDDVIDVVEAEQTEDLLKFSGVSADEELGAHWHQAVKSRLPWLGLNLLTASLTTTVIGIYHDAITSMWLLAALGPVIGGLGGNAGTQALAVTVRRVSLGLIPPGGGRVIVAKELVVGLINGLVVGVVVGVAGWLLGGDWMVGLVALMAMWGNLMVAAVAGAAVPLALERIGIDPAVASSVFVTAFTDVFGYFLFLALATSLVLAL